ncbi:hypothetical protein I551_1388 [Mycobacterium ulcerans str. Harvey]|uniref:Uncharacterized protein n=1 Tax=Mycobacterium ulcerans str. Harvey TaxID=1299332 RepID=A0ABP3ALP0_MYCUL|nr:hypothetical protein I551_1388 [Mycobacterium ulcerans str. Harvey]
MALDRAKIRWLAPRGPAITPVNQVPRSDPLSCLNRPRAEFARGNLEACRTRWPAGGY